MNTKPHLKNVLDMIAQRDISETTDLWSQIEEQIEAQPPLPMRSRMKLAWTLVLVLLGLIIATTAAYAIYHYFTDPGLRSASEAGLVTHLEQTAIPTPLPTSTPIAPAVLLGMEQKLVNLTLSLDWVYMNNTLQAVSFTARGLPPDLKLGMPQLSFGALTPEQFRGAGLALQSDTDTITGTYVIRQILRAENYDGQTEGQADLSLDIPILDLEGRTMKTFHFDVPQMPIHLDPMRGSNVYATRSQGVELSLDWIRLSPQDTQARLCVQNSQEQSWEIQSASLQLVETPADVLDTPAMESQQVSSSFTENGKTCADVTFPLGAPNAGFMRLVVNQLVNPQGQRLDGTWEFTWDALPNRLPIPGTASPTPASPLATQVVGNMTATLIEAYADENRLALVVNLQPLPEGFGPYDLALKDDQGNEINAGFGASSSESDPNTFEFIITPIKSLTGERFIGQFVLGIRPIMAETATHVFHFDLDLPIYPARILYPQQMVHANGIEMHLVKLKITPSYTQAYLCYAKPTGKDWGIGYASSLQIGGDQARMDNYSLLFDAEIPGMDQTPEPDWVIPAAAGRCVIAGYPVGYHDQTETLTLTIPELEQSVPEVITEEQIQVARQKLSQEGIEMDWVVSVGNGGGGAFPVITKKPVGMTDEEVLRRFYQLLGYYFPGPWVFSLIIHP